MRFEIFNQKNIFSAFFDAVEKFEEPNQPKTPRLITVEHDMIIKWFLSNNSKRNLWSSIRRICMWLIIFLQTIRAGFGGR